MDQVQDAVGWRRGESKEKHGNIIQPWIYMDVVSTLIVICRDVVHHIYIPYIRVLIVCTYTHTAVVYQHTRYVLPAGNNYLVINSVIDRHCYYT